MNTLYDDIATALVTFGFAITVATMSVAAIAGVA